MGAGCGKKRLRGTDTGPEGPASSGSAPAGPEAWASRTFPPLTDEDETCTGLTRGHRRVAESRSGHTVRNLVCPPLSPTWLLLKPRKAAETVWSSRKDPGVLCPCPSYTLLCVPGQLTSLSPQLRQLSRSHFPTPKFHIPRGQRRRAAGANRRNPAVTLEGRGQGGCWKRWA